MHGQEGYPLVSIIVLNYNGAEHLPVCIESLLAQDYPNTEIVVADNGSTDESRVICDRYAGVIFAGLGYNYGFGKGNNEGAKYSKGEFLFFVNNDMRFEPNVLSILVNTIMKNDKVFALDIKQYNWTGDKIIHSALGFKRGGLWGTFLPFIDCEQHDTLEIVEVPWANGANFFCRRDRFFELGGFDQTFFIDVEDTDLGWRAWLRGWKTYYVPTAACYHKVGAAFSNERTNKSKRKAKQTPWWRKRFYSGQTNRVRFTMKTMGVWMNFLCFARNHILAMVYFLLGRPVNAIIMLKAWWRNFLCLRQVLSERQYLLSKSVVASETLIDAFWAEKSKRSRSDLSVLKAYDRNN